jgi:hypothetical protein
LLELTKQLKKVGVASYKVGSADDGRLEREKGADEQRAVCSFADSYMVEEVLFTDEIIAIMVEFHAHDVNRVKIVDVLKKISDTPELVEDYKLWDQWDVKFVGEEWDNKFERMARNLKFIAGGCTQALQSLNNGVVSAIIMVIAALLVPIKIQKDCWVFIGYAYGLLRHLSCEDLCC